MNVVISDVKPALLIIKAVFNSRPLTGTSCNIVLNYGNISDLYASLKFPAVILYYFNNYFCLTRMHLMKSNFESFSSHFYRFVKKVHFPVLAVCIIDHITFPWHLSIQVITCLFSSVFHRAVAGQWWNITNRFIWPVKKALVLLHTWFICHSWHALLGCISQFVFFCRKACWNMWQYAGNFLFLIVWIVMLQESCWWIPF